MPPWQKKNRNFKPGRNLFPLLKSIKGNFIENCAMSHNLSKGRVVKVMIFYKKVILPAW